MSRDRDSVTAQWSPAGAAERVSVTGRARCEYEDGVRNTRRAVSLGPNGTSGVATFSVDTMLAATPVAPLTQARLLRCDLVIEVEQQRNGTPDARFGGSGAAFLGGDGVVGRVTRSVTLDYVPRPYPAGPHATLLGACFAGR